ncbi:carboxyl transferase domain-containing protein [Propionibacteriaceae bacterium Y1685]
MSTPPERPADPERPAAPDRLAGLLDADSFLETGRAAGTVVGHGTIADQPVCVHLTDHPTAAGLALVARLVDLAARTGCPVIGLFGDGGKTGEAEALMGPTGRLQRTMTRASGVIPQVIIVSGALDGAAAVTAALADVVVLAGSDARLQGPSDDALATAGATAQPWPADAATEDEASACAWVRTMITFLPQNNLSDPVPGDPDVPAGPALPEPPTADHRPYDVHPVINSILDDGGLFELRVDHAPHLVCGFGRLAGRTVGVVADQPEMLGGCLDAESAAKAARFVRLCDAFNIAVITMVDCPGFLPEQDSRAVSAAAALVHALAAASVPWLSVITGRALGPSYEILASRDLGADLVLGWPHARIAATSPQAEVRRRHHDQLADAEDAETLRAEFLEAVAAERTAEHALSEGLVDLVVSPAETRRHLVRSLALVSSKRDDQPPRKHGNIPL